MGVDTNEKNNIAERYEECVAYMKNENEYKTKSTAFTRKRKLGFEEIFIGILSSLKKTLVLELESLLKKLKKQNMEYSKQAYSKARQNISPKAFKKLNETIKEDLYAKDKKTYKGYRVTAIDGSAVELPNTKEIKEKYGVFKEGTPNAAGKVHVIYDVRNEIVIDGILGKYKESEQDNAIKLIKENIKPEEKELILFDRGYPAVRLIKELNEVKAKYIFRVNSRFLREVNEFTQGKETDKTIEINIDDKRLEEKSISNISEAIKFNLRCVRIKIESGDEILITNLSEEEANLEELCELYNSRWGIEKNYNIMKNVLEIENFTGDTEIAIQQDFYATIVLANLTTALIRDAQQEYEAKKKSNKKYEYKINKTIAIGYLKTEMLEIFLEEDEVVCSKLWDKLIKKISKHIIPIRNNRKFARPTGHRPKYGRTAKKVL